MTDSKGKVTEFRAPDFTEDPNKFVIHRMTCMDCHNRPAHQFQPPGDAIDVAMSLGRIDPTIPLIRSNLMALFSTTNATVTAGLQRIASSLKASYPKEPKVETVIAEAQQIYTNNFFPEMKADWRNYPNNIGHMRWPGCFRCHDGQHKTADGNQAIGASGCNDCHIILSQGTGPQAHQLFPQGKTFFHPDPSSEGTDPDCFFCHSANP
ncbi:MAG: hypothetical protein M1608_09345 [Candidatus Omnitrophica bacterium]|nr:hypothetical protein [Candidatus Omnitrophota bacterium]